MMRKCDYCGAENWYYREYPDTNQVVAVCQECERQVSWTQKYHWKPYLHEEKEPEDGLFDHTKSKKEIEAERKTLNKGGFSAEEVRKNHIEVEKLKRRYRNSR